MTGMSQERQSKGVRRSRPVRRWALLALVGLLAVLAPTAQTVRSAPDAGALGAFDTTLLNLINDHRVSLGLNPFSEYAPFSDASLNWSRVMRNDSAFCAAAAGFRHDTNANIGSQGVPPGTTSAGENIAWSCGQPGVPSPTNWTYNRMPAQCVGSLDYTSALLQFCQWIDSTGHRQAIESTAYTWIGLGTISRAQGGLAENFSTARFAVAPGGGGAGSGDGYVNGLCDGKAITIDMNDDLAMIWAMVMAMRASNAMGASEARRAGE